MTDTSFSGILKKIAQLHQQHPDYTFDHIMEHIHTLEDAESPEAWVVELYNQFQEMSAPRQHICQQIFESALQRAQQATYRPVNALDQFLERQLYGIQDEKIVEKGLIGQFLEQQKAEKAEKAEQARRRPRPPRPGRTNPLSPNALPGRPPEG